MAVGTVVPAQYKIWFFDRSGNLAATPQSVISASFTDVINGGNAEGNIVIPRRWVDSGWVDYGYRVQVYLPDSVNPWYDGRVMEIDLEQQNNSESINVLVEGWQTLLADAVVSGVLSPGTQPDGSFNTPVDLRTFLSVYLLTPFLDSSKFGLPYVDPSLTYYLDALNFDASPLNTCIDEAVKQITTVTGQVIEWFVRGLAGALPSIVVQPQLNPNVATSGRIAPTITSIVPYFNYETKDITISDYRVQSNARQIVNMIALYGGKDANGIQVYGAFKDANTSISLYGVRQKKVTNSTLLSQQSLLNYATAYLLLNGYPQLQGSYKKKIPSDAVRAGTWAQIEVPGSKDLTLPQSIQQVRLVKVTLDITGNETVQTCYTNAPRPFIDHAYYSSINAIAGKTAAAASLAGFTQLSNHYVTGNKTPTTPSNSTGTTTQANLIYDPLFTIGTTYGKNNNATPPYSTNWSFAYIGDMNFFLQYAVDRGVLNSSRSTSGALSKPFPFYKGTYTLSYFINTLGSSPGGGVWWSIVTDLGPGVNANDYTSAQQLFSVQAYSTTNGVLTGSYINPSTTIPTARVLFRSTYPGFFKTSSPVLAFAP